MERVIIEVEAEMLEGLTSLLEAAVADLKDGWTAIERTNDRSHSKMLVVDPAENDQTAFPELPAMVVTNTGKTQ